MISDKCKVWAICEAHLDRSGHQAPVYIPKKIYDSQAEAEEHVFPPYVVKGIEFSIDSEMKKFMAHINPAIIWIMRNYKPEAVIRHLMGGETLGGKQ